MTLRVHGCHISFLGSELLADGGHKSFEGYAPTFLTAISQATSSLQSALASRSVTELWGALLSSQVCLDGCLSYARVLAHQVNCTSMNSGCPFRRTAVPGTSIWSGRRLGSFSNSPYRPSGNCSGYPL